MAERTDKRLTRDLMLEAVPCGDDKDDILNQEHLSLTNSSANILAARDTWSFGADFATISGISRSVIPTIDLRMTSDIMEVPLPRASERRFISFLTFQISMFFSASLACGALMATEILTETYSAQEERRPSAGNGSR